MVSLRVGEGAELAADALFEREVELAEIACLIGDVPQGRGGLLVIIGPAGIGKSRLVDAAVAASARRGLKTLVASAGEGERTFPFAVVLQLLERLVRGLGPAERREVFSGAAGLAAPLLAPEETVATGEPPARLFALIHGLYWLVVNLSERAPLMMVVDDAHAADQPSLRFLLYLTQRLEDLPVGVALSARPGEPDAHDELAELFTNPHAHVLRPAPLSARGVSAMIEAQLGLAANERFAAVCAEVTRGNPFLLRELLAGLAAEGIEEHTATADRARSLAPHAVRQRLVVRMMRLPSIAGALARAVAVLGDPVALRLAAQLAGLEPGQAAAAVDALAGVEIVRPLDASGHVTFVHPLVRAALYEDLPRAQRADAHARAASLLIDAGAPSERIVAHLLCAETGTVPCAVELLCDAATDATSRGAPEAATNFLRRALEEPNEPEMCGRLQLDLAAAELAAGDAPAAEEAARRAAQLLCDPCARAQAQLTLGRALYAQARHAEAAVAFEEGLSRIDTDAHQELAHELRAAYAVSASLDATLAERGVAVAELILREDTGEPSLSERALLAQLAVKRAWAAEPRERVWALAERAWGDGALLDAETVDGTIWTLVTAALAWSEYLQRDIQICSAALETAQARGSPLAFATASYCRSWPLLQIGRVDDAIADAETALRARRHGWEQHRGSAAAILAHALLEKGYVDEAACALAPIDEPQMKTRIDYALLLEARARLALARGQPDLAFSDAREAGRMLEEVFPMRNPWVAWRPTAALAASALGDIVRARALLDQELELSEAVGAPAMMCRALRTRGVIETGEHRLDLLSQAVSVVERTSPRLEHIRALVDYGAALRRTNRRRAAREPLEHGFRLAARGGASVLAERARVELAALGARPRKDLAARDRLTPSELRVAEMAARGMTNKQIAQALFVTLKTIEGHLHNTYQKLDIESRAQLKSALERAGACDSAALPDERQLSRP